MYTIIYQNQFGQKFSFPCPKHLVTKEEKILESQGLILLNPSKHQIEK